MSTVESKIGSLTRDLSGVICDNVISNVNILLLNEMKLTNDQTLKIDSVIRSCVEDACFNSVGRYVKIFNETNK
jgi:hypothetical protein